MSETCSEIVANKTKNPSKNIERQNSVRWKENTM